MEGPTRLDFQRPMPRHLILKECARRGAFAEDGEGTRAHHCAHITCPRHEVIESLLATRVRSCAPWVRWHRLVMFGTAAKPSVAVAHLDGGN